MKYSSVIFLILICVTSNYASAKQCEYKGNCKFNGSSYDFEDCLKAELKNYDSELNRIYNTRYKVDGNNDYKKNELLWIKFKEADCDYMASRVNGGVEYQSVFLACLINKTKARIDDLNRSFFYTEWFEQSFLKN